MKAIVAMAAVVAMLEACDSHRLVDADAAATPGAVAYAPGDAGAGDGGPATCQRWPDDLQSRLPSWCTPRHENKICRASGCEDFCGEGEFSIDCGDYGGRPAPAAALELGCTRSPISKTASLPLEVFCCPAPASCPRPDAGSANPADWSYPPLPNGTKNEGELCRQWPHALDVPAGNHPQPAGPFGPAEPGVAGCFAQVPYRYCFNVSGGGRQVPEEICMYSCPAGHFDLVCRGPRGAGATSAPAPDPTLGCVPRNAVGPDQWPPEDRDFNGWCCPCSRGP